MLLFDVVTASEAVRATRSRTAKVELLAACLKSMQADEIALGAAFLSGEHPLGRLGVSWRTLHEVRPAPASPPPTLTIHAVDAALRQVAATTGPGSAARRKQLLDSLFQRATEPEQLFLQALILRELRQGALEGLLVEAIGRAFEVPTDALRRALMMSGEVGAVVSAARSGGEKALARFSLTLFRPLQPMLAQSAPDLESALTRAAPAALEAKIDGVRIQVHRDGEEVGVYTRNLREITPQVPEVVEAVRSIPARLLVLDGEVVAASPDGKPLAFQVTMGRLGGKKAQSTPAVPLIPFFFDCLHVDGADLLQKSGAERFGVLETLLHPALLVPRAVQPSLTEASAFYDRMLELGYEGVMVKSLEARYEAGRRGAAWLKVKPSFTLDLVVLAAEWGSGRRKGWLSNLHLGARDPDSGGFVMLGKTFKGLTDDLLQWQTERFLGLETRRDRHIVHVRPEQVVEVAFDGVQASSRYPGGMALRFARVKGYRHDKTAADADTIDAVRAIYRGE
jgi:DNA ligase-1